MSFLSRLFNSKKKHDSPSIVSQVTNKKTSYLEMNPVDDWDQEHVEEWFSLLKLGEDKQKLVSEVVVKEKMDGPKLVAIKGMGPFKKMFPKLEMADQKKCWVLIRELKKKKKFDRVWTLIFCKYYGMCVHKNQPGVGESLKYAGRIANFDEFYDRYFSFFVEYFELEELNEEIKDLRSRKKGSKAVKLEEKAQQMAQCALKKFAKMTGEKEMEKMKFFAGRCGIRKPQRKKDDKKKKKQKPTVAEEHYRIPCKIIVTEIFDESMTIQKKFRYAVSPFLDLISFNSLKFGIFHTAITIGPWYLEWTTSELVIPKKSFFSAKAVISMDVDVCHEVSGKNIKEIVTKISRVLHLWNTTMEYGQKRTGNKGNCQDFVDDVIAAVGINPDQIFKGTFGKIIKRMRKNGKCDMSYTPHEDLAKKENISKKNIKFSTHVELDEFVKNTFATNSNSVDFREDYQLLKAFDRAFWLRHIQNKETDTFKPLMDDLDMVACPFDDPRKTMSYI